MILKAQKFAAKAHEGVVRRYSGLPYIVHPARVASKVEAVFMPEHVVVAAWLHDTVEDTEVTVEEIRCEFGDEVAAIVEELTNPSKGFPELSREDRKAMDRQHIYGVSQYAKVVKLADRIDNLRGIIFEASEDFARLYLRESDALLVSLLDVCELLETELTCIIRNGFEKFR